MIILRNIIYIIFDLLFVYGIHIFLSAFFNKKLSTIKLLLMYTGYIIVDCLIYFFIDNSTVFMSSGLILYFILGLLYSRFCKKNLIAPLFVLLFSICSELLATGIVSIIGIIGLTISTNLSIIAAIIISRLSFFIIIMIAIQFVKFQRREKDIRHYGIQIFITPLFSIWLVYYIFSLLEFNQFSLISIDNIFLIISMAMIVAINILSFYMYDRQYRIYTLSRNNINLHNALNMQMNQYTSESDMRKAFRLERHNLKNYLISIQSDLQSNDICTVQKKLNDYIGSINGQSGYANSGCLPIDSVINIKGEAAAAKGIHVTCDISLGSIPCIKSEDICILIGCGMDNAIEYLSGNKELTQIINININYISKMLCINIENPVNISPKIINSSYIESTKTSEGHGYGLLSAKYIADKYDGSIILSCQNNTFSFGARLNDNQ